MPLLHQKPLYIFSPSSNIHFLPNTFIYVCICIYGVQFYIVENMKQTKIYINIDCVLSSQGIGNILSLQIL
jgi:hypothetical protein